MTAAITNCSAFLRSELFAAQPERILALGRHPFEALCHIFALNASKTVADFRTNVWWAQFGATKVALSGTFFPGNNRHNGRDLIPQDIARMLSFEPQHIDTE